MSTSKEIKLLSTRWIVYSVLGLLMMATGLVVLMEAIVQRINSSDNYDYIALLVVALVIFSAGISFIGTSVKYRIYLDRKRKHDDEFHGPRSAATSHKSRSHSGSHRSSRSSSSSTSED